MSTRGLALGLVFGPLLWPATARAQQVDVYQRPLQYERSHDYDVLNYAIRLSVDQAARSFEGQTTITLRSLQDGFESCVLDAETFEVSAVEMAPHQPLAFEQTPTKLVVQLKHAYDYGQTLSFTVSYRAVDPHVDPVKHGMPKDYDLGLTFKPATSTRPAIASTLSFPEGAHHWFPCYDQPDDKATSDVMATVDPQDQAISNGRLVEMTQDPSTGRRTFHWAEDKPYSTYLYVLVVGPYVKVADSLGSLPVDYWVYPAHVADAQRSFHNTPKMIEFFGDLFSYPYPWPKYDQITLPRFGGGAESTSATVVGDGTIHDAKADPDFPSDGLVAHELAHQWWGDLVTMRDWSETWLNESFATYFEYVYSRHARGDDEGALDLQGKIDAYLREAHTRYERPIVFRRWEFPNDNFDRHTYQKGAAVLHMLDWVLGHEAFLRALSHFLREHAYQPVDTHDLEIAITESTGQALGWFFDEWVYKAGHPVFDVNYSWDPASHVVHLDVAQVQHTSEWVPIFQMPVIIRITTATDTRDHRVQIREPKQRFDFESREKPLLVRFDQGNHLLKEITFQKPTEELVFQLQHDDVIGRVWAAEQLSQHLADAQAAAALRQSAEEDPFWAVRKKALEALAPSLGAVDVSFLKKQALDPKSDVRAAALTALGSLHDRSLGSFLQERYAADASYVAQAAALRATGACGDSSAITFLERAAEAPSPRDVLRKAAEDALRQLRK